MFDNGLATLQPKYSILAYGGNEQYATYSELAGPILVGIINGALVMSDQWFFFIFERIIDW